MAATQADFRLVPDYSIVDPRRNWYQISIAGSDRPLYAEESPPNIVRRLQSENGISPADGVIRDNVLALVERLVSEGARSYPSDSADIYLATIRDDRSRFRSNPSGPISEGAWKAIIWASRDDLRQSPQALFDGALRLDAFRGTQAIRMPLFGVDLPVALGVRDVQPKPQPVLQPSPSEAGENPTAEGGTNSLVVQGTTSILAAWERARPYAPAVIAGVVSIAGIAILWSLMRKEESQQPYGNNMERFR